MAVTITKVTGPTYLQGDGVKFTFNIALDSSFASGGEPLNLTSYLGYLTYAFPANVEAIADAVYLPMIVGPGPTVALSSTNVLLQMLRTAAIPAASQSAQPFAEATSVDLHTIGELKIVCIGKEAIPTDGHA